MARLILAVIGLGLISTLSGCMGPRPYNYGQAYYSSPSTYAPLAAMPAAGCNCQ